MLLFSFLKKPIGLSTLKFWAILLGFLLVYPLSAQNDLWIPKADLGDGTSGMKRTGAVSFTISGKVYIALGKDGSTYHQDVWVYDTISEAWTQKADFIGTGRIGAFSMVMNNKAIIGTGETSGGSRTSTVYKFEPVSNIWTPLSDFAGGVRSYASAFSMGTRGFVIGGDDGAFQNDLWEYNINTDSWIGKQAFPGIARMKAVAFTIGTMGYYGTGDVGAGTPSSDFWEYNIITNNWTQLADFPGAARVGAIGCSNGTNAYIGLGNDGAFLLDFWQFDGANFAQQSDFIGSARELAVATVSGNKVYAGTGFGGSIYKDFYQWDPCANPQITVQPVGLEVCEATDVTFTVEISNTGGESYEWLLDGSPVAGGNTNILNITGVTEAEEGSYTCKITNSCGTSVSDAAILSVIPLPVLIPTGLFANPDTLCPGNAFDITLSADDNGDDQDTLRWYAVACGGDLIGTGFPVNSDLVVPAPDPLITTAFFARWENQCGASDCDTLTIYVKENAIEPTSINRSMDTICYDYDSDLLLIADGGMGDSLVWYKGDICNDANAQYLGTGDTLDLFALGMIPTESSLYSVRWETYCGGSEFNSTCLTIDIIVNGEISIIQHPQNKSVCDGAETVQFGVGVDPGLSLTNIFYQWYFNGLAISGATLDTVTLIDITAVDSGYYHCKVFNACDTLYSDSAHLTVNLGPNIIIEPSILDTICEGDSLTMTLQAEGTTALQYQWFFNDVPTAIIDTFFTINPATFANTGDYYCVVTNSCGVDTSLVVSIEVDSIPSINLQPLDQIVCLNGTAEFEVAADGTLPITYQWYKIDHSGVSSLMSGETSTLLEITPVLSADTAFSYFCMVSNECFDGPSSDTASLEMHAQIQVMDSILSDTNNICYTYPTYLHLTAYGGAGDSIRWYSGSCEGDTIAITVDTTLTIDVPLETTTYFARWENPCGVSSCDSITIFIAQDPQVMDTLFFEDNDICYNAYDSILLTAVGGNGDSIHWYNAFDCNGTPFAVTADTFVYVHNIPINSAPYAAKWVNACGESECLTTGLYINNLTTILHQTQGLTLCEGSSSQMYVEAGGTEPFFYQWYFNGVELAGEINDTLHVGPISFADTGMYFCQVRSECDTALSDSIPLVMLELPYFTQMPRDTSVCEGTRDTIQIKVAGDMPILVQWFKNNVEIGGLTLLDTLLIIDPVYETADYFARITNGCGIAYSDTITHRALDTIIITQQPQNQNLCLLDTAYFNVVAEVNEFVVYNWYKIGDPASLSNDSSLTIPNLDYTNEGAYYCIISDTCGEMSTDTAILNMNIPPQITTDPFGATVCEGTFFQFEATIIGDSLEYQWNYNGIWLPNTDTNVFIFDPVERGDEGTYYVEAVNNCGDDESIPVDLVVNYLPDRLDYLSVSPDSVCNDCPYNEHELFAFGDGGGYGDHIEWYGPETGCGGDTIGTGDHIIIDKIELTSYYYARWVNQCTDQVDYPCDSIRITLVPDPIPVEDIAVDTNNICANYPDSLLLTAIGGYGRDLRWYTADTSEVNFIGTGGQIRVPAPPDTTVYIVFWRNMCGDSEYTTKQVNVIPLAQVMVREYDTICAMQPYQLEQVYANYYDSIKWTTSSPTGFFDTSNIQFPIYYDPGIDVYDTVTQYLTLTGYGISVCDNAIDSLRLTYFPIPKLSYEPEITAICRDSIIILTADGADTYFWKPLDVVAETLEGNPISLSPWETVDYNLIGTNERGCVDSLLFTVEVYPSPLVDLGDSVFLYSCEPVQLDAGGGDGSDYYIWSNGFRTRTITVYETGNYSVIVGNPGCFVSDTGYISLCNGRMFMPNAFTPNEDGLNETFKPITSDPSVEFHMMIFDRLGQMLFETYDIHEGWDGNKNGEPLPAGNYVWRIDYQGQGVESPGKKGSEVGTVMLVR